MSSRNTPSSKRKRTSDRDVPYTTGSKRSRASGTDSFEPSASATTTPSPPVTRTRQTARRTGGMPLPSRPVPVVTPTSKAVPKHASKVVSISSNTRRPVARPRPTDPDVGDVEMVPVPTNGRAARRIHLSPSPSPPSPSSPPSPPRQRRSIVSVKIPLLSQSARPHVRYPFSTPSDNLNIRDAPPSGRPRRSLATVSDSPNPEVEQAAEPVRRPRQSEPTRSTGTNQEVGVAGPGPRTARNRQLGPVPQPSPNLFRLYIGSGDPPSHSQSQWQSEDNIGDFTSSPILAPRVNEDEPQSLEADAVVEGREVWRALSEPSSDESQPRPTQPKVVSNDTQSHLCRWSQCHKKLGSASELSRHIRAHADMVDPTPDPTLTKLSELEARVEEGSGVVKRLEEQLTREIERASRAEAALEDATARATASETKARDAAAEVSLLSVEQTVIDAPEGSQEALLQEKDQRIASLRRKLKESNSNLKDARSDLAFFREQYETASSSAVAEVKRAAALEAQVTKLQEQLTLGLKQRDLHAAAAARHRSTAKDKDQMQLNILLEQSRRTDDAVRRKATAHARLTKENRELERELHEARSKADELRKRNDELSERVALLRGRMIGAFDGDESDHSDSGEGEDFVGSMAGGLLSAGGATATRGENAPLGGNGGLGADGPDMTMAGMEPVVVPPLLVPDDKPTPPAMGQATLADGGIEAFVCKWALQGGEGRCPEIFTSLEELHAHGVDHIQKVTES